MNQDHLISKKDLLARYGVSYGALYRWKRKGLIPDEWFIKKSTTTGQETFFPEKLVCERIETIQKMKEDVLLDELAKQFSGEDRRNEAILLHTEFGEKSFRWCDVKGIFLVRKNGERVDITAAVKELLEEKERQE